VAYSETTDQLPNTIDMKRETVLVVIDRADREWTVTSYLAIERDGQLSVQWFDTEPDDVEIVGKVILILRPKHIFDESNITEPWQMDD
jgi:hypothetical protein